jgi:hypothetical protein
MPRKRTAKHLPRAMTQLAIVMEDKPLPEGMDKVFEIVRLALKDKDDRHNPITTVNRKLGQLKRRDPDSLLSMCDWLCDPKNGQLLTGLGQSGNRIVWAIAIVRMLADISAVSAFGSEPGPKPSWGFSKDHRRGLQVLCKIKIDKTNPEKAIEQVLNKEGMTDDRDLRRSYSDIKNMGISDQTLQLLSKT